MVLPQRVCQLSSALPAATAYTIELARWLTQCSSGAGIASYSTHESARRFGLLAPARLQPRSSPALSSEQCFVLGPWRACGELRSATEYRTVLSCVVRAALVRSPSSDPKGKFPSHK